LGAPRFEAAFFAPPRFELLGLRELLGLERFVPLAPPRFEAGLRLLFGAERFELFGAPLVLLRRFAVVFRRFELFGALPLFARLRVELFRLRLLFGFELGAAMEIGAIITGMPIMVPEGATPETSVAPPPSRVACMLS
jgi:hypothetical protein